MNRPNFFIVGFGRSGSTSLYKYLEQHPDIYMSPVKEPKFFSTDMGEGARTATVDNLSDYLALYAGAEGEKVLGEASTMYILSDEAPQRIHSFDPDAKIVILLRNPLEFLRSWHSLGVRDGYESEPDLMKALALEAERTSQGGARDRGAEISYRYRHVIHRAPELVTRWYDTFGASQIKVIVFDDLSERTEETYADLLEFLEVDVEPIRTLEVHNSAKAFAKSKTTWIDNLRRQRGLVRTLRRVVPTSAFAKLRKAFTTDVERQELSTQDRQSLRDEFTPGVKELEVIVGRDLSSWYDA